MANQNLNQQPQTQASRKPMPQQPDRSQSDKRGSKSDRSGSSEIVQDDEDQEN